MVRENDDDNNNIDFMEKIWLHFYFVYLLLFFCSICSCGKWICTSFPCIDETATTTTENYNQYEDMDNQID